MSQSRCTVVTEPIDPGALLARPGSAADGATLLFLGIVRNHNEGRRVTHLEYEAYAPMAERELGVIAAEAEARWGTGRITVVHRVGHLQVGEPSVAVLVSAPHRGEAYEASRYVIDELKKRVPIWKREGYVEGPPEWRPGNPPTGPAGEMVLD